MISEMETPLASGSGTTAGQKPSPANWRRLLPLALLAAGFTGYFALGLDKYLSFQALADHRLQLQELVAANEFAVTLAFFVLYALSVAFSLPSATLLTVTAGFLFGTVMGGFWVVISATLGATAVFLAARSAFGDGLRRRAGPGLKRFEAGFRSNAVSYLLVLRLVPLFPFFLVNIGPALLGVPLRTYVATTLVGIIPGTFVYTSVGNGIGKVFDQGRSPDLGIIFSPEILGPIVGLALLALLPVAYKRYKAATAA